ncbi:glycosyltransferase [Chryseobacterium sp. C-71]|uniref:glycosyltransferase family 2 protein n=1 Tax=Chryseobacterium sp. C-71 TaxID=2893882 RepID=UPI001E3DCD7F|nr:glycosyltransferase family 2 protein [Chryseobacterium sp. C-71]UFH33327.1 glycosyltransferase [Chryseobacterium sp. C-71]
MKISVITVCYNSAATIEDTIKSVMEQTYDDIEYIIVDGNSKDATLHIINQYENSITKWISEPDNGLYDAMNKGIKLATGDIIGILNSDDLFCDCDAISKVMTIFNNDKKLDSVYADIYYVDQNNTNNIVRKWKSGLRKKFSTGWHPAHPTFYVKKNIYDEYGYFDLSFKLASDFEIMLRFLDRYNISTYYLAEPLIKMRLGGETNKSFKNIINQNLECIKAFKNNEVKVSTFLYPFKRLLPKFKQYL